MIALLLVVALFLFLTFVGQAVISLLRPRLGVLWSWFIAPMAGLALLLSRPVGEAGEYVELKRTGEILRVIEAFLRHHFHRFQGLRSLELLRTLQGPGSSEAA